MATETAPCPNCGGTGTAQAGSGQPPGTPCNMCHGDGRVTVIS